MFETRPTVRRGIRDGNPLTVIEPMKQRLTRFLEICGAAGVFLLLAAAAFAQDEGHGDSGGLAGQLHFDPAIILAQAVGFLVMFFILWKTLFSKVGGMLDKRRDDILSRIQKLEHDQAEANRIREEAQKILDQAARDAQARIQAALETVERQREEIISDAHRVAALEIEEARGVIEREKNQAVLAIRKEVADLVLQATSQLLQENLDDARHRRVVESFIQQI